MGERDVKSSLMDIIAAAILITVVCWGAYSHFGY
jgi:hypothetical protein